MSRLVIVSNRVAPITEGKPTAGGLAIGVFDALKNTGGMWFGWNGEIDAVPATAPDIAHRNNVTFATVPLTRRDYNTYYRGFSNATLWPTFHYRDDLTRFQRDDYNGYRHVNARFASLLAPLLQPDDLIWVHDYHLLPFAQACRHIGIKQRLGFFLHIPFPSPQVLMTVPPHEALVRAMCEYDLVGFQTEPDRTAFTDYLVRYAGGTLHDDGTVTAYGRTFRTGVYPIGVYPDEIQQQATARATVKHILDLKQGLQQRKLIMSVDRLDYSKGMLERFRAFERLLELWPNQQGTVSFVQVAPPSRSDVAGYGEIRRQLETEAGHINGRFSDLAWTPLRYINKRYDHEVLMSFFRASQVGYVTPLRDGMNLVAKEYVASQDPADPGVLVLSCFAGAAQELDGALIVNPYDIDEMAEALRSALNMSLSERQSRYEGMMATLREHNLSTWRDRFMTDLRTPSATTPATPVLVRCAQPAAA
ncbi:alpha,alpha-trehalose-phosphate synthase (UDP-forming) [Pandoraea norimbergensis]|uniref:Trehalose-6-phosphate synthase n=1 Tax=Pandoraea norimbergensis TaxID=93219 RepID=A0ABM5WM41_9BURK|nr:alpha,alpha-trehalose-phosphate synthase (UDP-forming) [Pandoraea norimbergensis]ALS61462.1 alpha,alpha-trehalose-phosphate synthase (UDP-forming) [Pandoraea norimbergensis]